MRKTRLVYRRNKIYKFIRRNREYICQAGGIFLIGWFVGTIIGALI